MKKYKWGVRKKMLWFMMPAVILLYVITALTANYFFRQALINRSWEEVRRESAILTDQIENTFLNVSSCAKSLIRNLNYDDNKKFLEQKEGTPLQSYTRERTIRGVIYDNSIFYPEAQAIVFADENENCYISDPRIKVSEDILLKMEQQLGTKTSQDVWFTPHIREEMVIYDDEVVCTLGKRVKDMDSGKNLGVLFINVQEHDIRNHYAQLEEGDSKKYFVVDGGGRVISASDPELIWSELDIFTPGDRLGSADYIQEQVVFQGKKVLMTMEKIGYSDLYLVDIIDLGILTAPSDRISLIVFMIGCLVLCFIIGLMNHLSLKITRPIEQLATEMSEIHSGNLKLHASVRSDDEIGMLANTCNYMLERIETEKETQRKLQLSLLQSQIKPHFLYNTLDLIYVLNSMGMEEKVEQAIKSLADYYRLALSDGKEIVSLDTEVNNVINYLKIQKMRYQEIFDYEMQISPQLLKYSIPKMTLQPLVENAIYHGIRPTGQKGKIVIYGEIKEHDIYITVADNGCGMTQEKAGEILERGNAGGSFGLWSVHARIQLLFGGGYGIRIIGRPGEGTSVCVHLSVERDSRKE